jgi:putative ABC transport system permease protein
MFLVVFDPATDFTVEPWLKERTGEGLKLGESVGGTYIFVPEGEQNIQLYGYLLTLRANLEPTGTALDQSMFLTMETARDMARISQTMALSPLEVPEGKISSIMIKVAPGYVIDEVALDIMHNVTGVTPIASSDLFRSYRQQMSGLRSSTIVTMGVTVTLSLLTLGLVFSLAANERRRELGMLRAMGATRSFVFRSLLFEAGTLALAGGVTGILLTLAVTYLFHDLIVYLLDIPFLLPTVPDLLGPVSAGLSMALVSITVAAVIPAYRISTMDPAAAMRD